MDIRGKTAFAGKDRAAAHYQGYCTHALISKSDCMDKTQPAKPQHGQKHAQSPNPSYEVTGNWWPLGECKFSSQMQPQETNHAQVRQSYTMHIWATLSRINEY